MLSFQSLVIPVQKATFLMMSHGKVRHITQPQLEGTQQNTNLHQSQNIEILSRIQISISSFQKM